MSITTPATLLVDSTEEYNYLTIHFWDDIDNEGPQRSERDLTIVCPSSVDLSDFAKTIAANAGLDVYIVDGVDTTTA